LLRTNQTLYGVFPFVLYSERPATEALLATWKTAMEPWGRHARARTENGGENN
jgi:hypothetical protein